MNEVIRWIMTPIELVMFIVFLVILSVGGFVVAPYTFIKYGVFGVEE